MEKTIEERAKESMYKYYQCNGEYTCAWISECEMCDGTNTPYDCCECTAEDYMQGYIQGATDQRKIDIEKACEWLHSTIGDGFVRYGNDRMVADNDQFEAMFRKAMEG